MESVRMELQPHSLTTGGRVDPLGLGATSPDFAWALPVEQRQTGYEIEVAAGSDFSESGVVWRSGVTSGAQPFGVAYAGVPLRSRAVYSGRVRVHEGGGRSQWSAPAMFEMGIIGHDRISAAWISAP